VATDELRGMRHACRLFSPRIPTFYTFRFFFLLGPSASNEEGQVQAPNVFYIVFHISLSFLFN